MWVAFPLLFSVLNGGDTIRSNDSTTTDECKIVYVVNHGWHSGIILNQSDLVIELPSLTEALREEEFVEIGWGDERFYQAEKVTPGMILRAVLWPTSSVLHVVAFPGPPGSYFSGLEVVELSLSEAGYNELLAFVAASFARTSDGAVIRLGHGLYGDSCFYSAEGGFTALNNCNTWVASAFETTGYSISSKTTITAQSVLSQLQGSNKIQCGSAH